MYLQKITTILEMTEILKKELKIPEKEALETARGMKYDYDNVYIIQKQDPLPNYIATYYVFYATIKEDLFITYKRKKVNLGKFELSLVLKPQCSCKARAITPVYPIGKTYIDRETPHPNVEGGTICLGDAREFLYKLQNTTKNYVIENFDLARAVLRCGDIENDGFIHRIAWFGYTCADCGNRVFDKEEDLKECPECEEMVCREKHWDQKNKMCKQCVKAKASGDHGYW